MTLKDRISALFSSKRAPDLAGPTRITRGQIPADPEFRRLPLLVWGDVFPNGDRPQVRRVLAGADAHECMYAWVYLNELLTARDMLQAVAEKNYAVAERVDMFKERFEALRKEVADPQWQISHDLIERFLPVAIFLKLAREGNAEFCELGSTLMASIEKIDFCSRLAGTPLDRASLLFSGIEYSQFLRRASLSFHPGDQIRLVSSAGEWRRQRPHVFQLSRFVGGYAFRATGSLAEQLMKSDAFHLTDVFNLEESDFHSWDLGLPITFMNLIELAGLLTDGDFSLYLTGIDPEYHAAGRKRAAVAGIFGIRKSVADRIRYFEHFERFGGFASVIGARPLARDNARQILAEVGRALSTEEWEVFAEYKKLFPIWGGPQKMSKDQLDRLVSSDDLGIDLTFDSLQAAAIVKDTLRANRWSPAQAGPRE